MSHIGKGNKPGEVVTWNGILQIWDNPQVNESVVFTDMTVRASQHWTIYKRLTIDAGMTLDIEAGAMVVVQP